MTISYAMNMFYKVGNKIETILYKSNLWWELTKGDIIMKN
jgi:hypothetical protein